MVVHANEDQLEAFRGLWRSVNEWHEVLEPTSSLERGMLVGHSKMPSYWYLMDWRELGARLAELGYSADEISFVFMMFGSSGQGFWPSQTAVRIKGLSEFFHYVRAVPESDSEDTNAWQRDQRFGVTQALRMALLSIVRTGRQVLWLSSDAHGWDREALVSLIEIDKSALEYERLGETLRHAQARDEWDFLRNLGRALGTDVTREELDLTKWVGLVAYFWEDWLSELTYRELLDFLVEEKVVPSAMTEGALTKTLHRASLRKPKKRAT